MVDIAANMLDPNHVDLVFQGFVDIGMGENGMKYISFKFPRQDDLHNRLLRTVRGYGAGERPNVTALKYDKLGERTLLLDRHSGPRMDDRPAILVEEGKKGYKAAITPFFVLVTTECPDMYSILRDLTEFYLGCVDVQCTIG